MRSDREVVFSGCEWIFCVNSPMPWRLLEEMWYKPVLLRVCALVCVGGDTHQHTHSSSSFAGKHLSLIHISEPTRPKR